MSERWSSPLASYIKLTPNGTKVKAPKPQERHLEAAMSVTFHKTTVCDGMKIHRIYNAANLRGLL